MKARPSRRLAEGLVTAPSLVWLTLLFLLPTLIVFAIAFKPVDPDGGIGAGWSLATVRSLSNPNYPAIIWRTVWLSLVTTIFCLVLAVPMSYHMARVGRRWRQILLLLTVVPFWTSFLVRIFAWKHLLHPEGGIKRFLVWLLGPEGALVSLVPAGALREAVAAHALSPDLTLLYRPGAVLMVMIYTYLPFAILPVYAAAEKFDFSLFEAAMDLGASRWKAFCRVFIPSIRRGILTAVLVVFIPALGSYVIPDVVGGPNSEMIGNKIAQRTFNDRNLPHAAGLSSFLTLAVLVPMLFIVIGRSRGGEAPRRIEGAA